MKKTVWTFGLIAGAVLSTMMAITMPFNETIGYDRALVIGYTTMVLGFLLVYFGVRSYRDNVAGGTVRFGRAFTVGMLIVVIASLCYVATWELMYFKLSPHYAKNLRARGDAPAIAAGGTPAEIEQRRLEQKTLWDSYDQPLVNVAYTIIEPLPVGLLIALVSAGILSRRRRPEAVQLSASAG